MTDSTRVSAVGMLYTPTTAALMNPSQPIFSDGFSCNTLPNNITARTDSHCKAYPRALMENSMNVGNAAIQPAANMPASCPYRVRVTNQDATITKHPAANAGNRSPKTELPNKRVLKWKSSVFSKWLFGARQFDRP
jgi:hypothetical protein